MAGNRDVNFTPPLGRSLPCGTGARREGPALARRPDQGQRRTFANPAGLRRGLPGWSPPPTATPSGALRRIGRRVPPSQTLPGHPARVDRARDAARARPARPGDRGPGSAEAEERSPLGSPLPCPMAGEPRPAWSASCGLKPCPLGAGAPLREGLTPPPAPGAPLRSSAPDFRAAEAPSGPGATDRREGHE